jgi:uncharacterized protein DUF5753
VGSTWRNRQFAGGTSRTDVTQTPLGAHLARQTPAYAKAVDNAWQRFIRSDLDAERAVSSRLRRQERLRGEDQLTLHALLDEAVIRRVIGGRTVMAGGSDACWKSLPSPTRTG